MRKQFLIGMAFLSICAFSFNRDIGAMNIVAMSDAAELGYRPQVSNDRQIKITATLQTVANSAKTWDIEVSLETHTHTLSDALENSSVLIVDGKQYQPLGWEGSPPGGHHRKGILRFRALDLKPPAVELQIRLIGDTEPRSFKWQLK